MKHCYTVTIIDDTPANLRLLESILHSSGYETRVFLDGNTALKSFDLCKPDLVLLDIKMPNLDGYEVCRRMKQHPETVEVPIIFISSLIELEDKIKAFESGAVDYITKPFQAAEVLMRVSTHLKIKTMQQELRNYSHHLEDLVKKQVADILQAQTATILALSKISEARDEETGQHIDRTRSYCLAIAKWMQKKLPFKRTINDVFVDNIYNSAPLHDIGKVAIPDNILLKKGKLTDEEFDVIKTHAMIGAQNLQAVLDTYPNNSFIKMGVEIARSHHEKWNGLGYPDGLKGDEIPLSAQIMAVADVYDALRSERCYKAAFSHEKSRDIILADIGTHFSPAVGEAFRELESDFDKISQKLTD